MLVMKLTDMNTLQSSKVPNKHVRVLHTTKKSKVLKRKY